MKTSAASMPVHTTLQQAVWGRSGTHGPRAVLPRHAPARPAALRLARRRRAAAPDDVGPRQHDRPARLEETVPPWRPGSASPAVRMRDSSERTATLRIGPASTLSCWVRPKDVLAGGVSAHLFETLARRLLSSVMRPPRRSSARGQLIRCLEAKSAGSFGPAWCGADASILRFGYVFGLLGFASHRRFTGPTNAFFMTRSLPKARRSANAGRCIPPTWRRSPTWTTNPRISRTVHLAPRFGVQTVAAGSRCATPPGLSISSPAC